MKNILIFLVLTLNSGAWARHFFQYQRVPLSVTDFTADGGAYGLLGGTFRKGNKVVGFLVDGKQVTHLEGEDLSDGRGVYPLNRETTIFLPRTPLSQGEIAYRRNGERKTFSFSVYDGSVRFEGIRDRLIRYVGSNGRWSCGIEGHLQISGSSLFWLIDVANDGRPLYIDDSRTLWLGVQRYFGFEKGCIGIDNTVIASGGSGVVRFRGETQESMRVDGLGSSTTLLETPNGLLFLLDYRMNSVAANGRQMRLEDAVKDLPVGFRIVRVHIDRSSNSFYLEMRDPFSTQKILGYITPLTVLSRGS